MVACYENWEKEQIRLVYRTRYYGGGEILLQKKKDDLPDEEMVIDDGAARCGQKDQPEKISDQNWVDEFECFYIKKSDTLSDIINGLNDFYHNVTSGVKKREITTQKKTSVGIPESEIGAKKSKQAIKNIKIEDAHLQFYYS